MSSPNAKPGKAVCLAAAKIMNQFYVSHRISILCQQQTIMFLLTQRQNEHLQKWLAMSTLHQAYLNSEESNPEKLPSLTKSAKLPLAV